MTATELPYGDVPGQTHWDGCWRARGHHNCAVREIERLRAAPREPAEADADLVALRSAEDEALDLLLRSYVPDEDDARRYRDAVVARVRAEEAPRAAPREPGEAERLKDVLDWFNGDGESLVYRAIEDVAEDGRYNAKHVAQYSCDAIARLLREQLLSAPRPDAGDGTGETTC